MNQGIRSAPIPGCSEVARTKNVNSAEARGPARVAAAEDGRTPVLAPIRTSSLKVKPTHALAFGRPS